MSKTSHGNNALEHKHYDFLDTFRAFAILGVVLTHMAWITPKLPNWLDNVTHFGSKGVQLFFVISGMTLTLVNNPGRVNLKTFYLRRYFRIAPMYYFAALSYLLIGLFLIPRVLPRNRSTASWITSLTFTNGWHPSTINSLVIGGWSIAAEMAFYLCFPLLLKLKPRPKLSVAVLFMSFVVSVFINRLIVRTVSGDEDLVEAFAYFFWITQIPAFICGVVIAAWLPTLIKYRATCRWVFPASVMSIVAASFTRGFSSSYIAADLLFIPFVISGAVSGYRIFSAHALVHIGKVSFSIYLVHFAVVGALLHVTPSLLGIFGAPAVVLMIYGVVMLISIVVATGTFRYIERPGMMLGRFLERRFAKARSLNV